MERGCGGMYLMYAIAEAVRLTPEIERAAACHPQRLQMCMLLPRWRMQLLHHPPLARTWTPARHRAPRAAPARVPAPLPAPYAAAPLESGWSAALPLVAPPGGIPVGCCRGGRNRGEELRRRRLRAGAGGRAQHGGGAHWVLARALHQGISLLCRVASLSKHAVPASQCCTAAV